MLSFDPLPVGVTPSTVTPAAASHVVGGTRIELGLRRRHVDGVAVVDQAHLLKSAFGVKLWSSEVGGRVQTPVCAGAPILFPPPLSQR